MASSNCRRGLTRTPRNSSPICIDGSEDSTQHEIHNAFDQLAEWGPNEIRQVEVRLLKNALCVAHRFETLGPMIGAHSTRADSPERQIILSVVQVCLVDGNAPGCRAL